MRLRMTIWQAAARALCVVALVAVGFSHRVPAMAAPVVSPAELAALTLPDGTMPELCLADQAVDESGKTYMGTGACEACLISASVLLPVPTDLTGKRLAVAGEVLLPQRVEAFYRQLFPPNAAPRAPPHPALA